GNTESIATFDTPVGTYVDEVYIARQNGNNVSFFDVEQIEVLRGPQGTLFGRNTTGGAVSVRMKRPAETFGGSAEIGYGSFDRKTARATVDLPVSSMFLTKLSAYWVDDQGYVKNTRTGEDLNGEDAWGVRGDVRIKAADNIVWHIGAQFDSNSSTNILNYVNGFSPLSKSGASGQRISRTGLSKYGEDQPLLTRALAGRGLGAEQKSVLVTSNLAADTDFGKFNLIIGGYRLSQDFIIDFFNGGLGDQGYRFGGFTIANQGRHNEVSVELKHTKSFFDGFADVISGLYYFKERNTTNFTDIFGTGPAATPTPLILADRILRNDLESIAGYTQSDFHLTKQLTFTAGVRWTQETKTISMTDKRAPGVGGAQRLDDAQLLANGIPLDQQKALWTPRFALNYALTDDIGVFVSATKGFKSGGWNARGTRADRIQPFGREAVWSYEAGLRSVLFNDMLRFNATGFFLDVKDLQTPSAFVDGTGSIQFITRNFADYRNKGVEIETDFAPTKALGLYAAIGFQDDEYRNLAPAIQAQLAACPGAPATNAGLGIVAPNCTVAEPVRTPKFTLTLGARYALKMPGFGTLTPSVNARHSSSTFTGTSNLANSFEDGFWLVNAGVSLVHDASGLSVIAECSNCNNVIYVQSNLPPTTYINEPRRWGVKVRYKF
ncbi:MAG: TonB-dependent receptor, partial [Parvularculaceae bacterium]|nr:TonB-dependent receptor [Parvularculaceae bacterium]